MNRHHAHRDDPWRWVSVTEFVAELVVFVLLCTLLIVLVFMAGDYR